MMRDPLFEILFFLFDRYFDANTPPDQAALTRELTLAGFEKDEISQAFDWLSGLESLSAADYPETLRASSAARVYADAELTRIGFDGRGFIAFLESSGMLDPVQREWVIDRALALGGEIGLDQIKWIVLMVLWKQGQADDYLFMEELFFGSGETPVYH